MADNNQPASPVVDHGITFGSQWFDRKDGARHTVMAVIARAGMSDEIRHSNNIDGTIVHEDSVEYFLNRFDPANPAATEDDITRGSRWTRKANGDEIFITRLKKDKEGSLNAYYENINQDGSAYTSVENFLTIFNFVSAKPETAADLVKGSTWRCLCNEHIKVTTIVGVSDNYVNFLNDTTYGLSLEADDIQWFLDNHVLLESNKPADINKYYKCQDCNNAYNANTINGQIIKEFGICNSCDFLRPQKKETPEFLKREERVIDGLNKSKAASDGKGARYFYVTFSYSVGGKRSYRKGRFCLQTDNGEIFNASKLEKTIRFKLKKKVKSVIIDNWNELNEADYKTLSGGQ